MEILARLEITVEGLRKWSCSHLPMVCGVYCRYLTLDDSVSVISSGSVPIVCGWPNYSVHFCWIAAVLYDLDNLLVMYSWLCVVD